MRDNPQLNDALCRIEAEEKALIMMKIEEQATMYREWKEKKLEERKAERHIRYDDRRNVNALTAIRRKTEYKSMTRLGQIQMELDRYWNPRGLEPPQELLEEYRKLKPRNRAAGGKPIPLLHAS